MLYFLLYYEILEPKLYEHFLLFHFATRMLSDPVLCRIKENIDYCETLLRYLFDSLKNYMENDLFL